MELQRIMRVKLPCGSLPKGPHGDSQNAIPAPIVPRGFDKPCLAEGVVREAENTKTNRSCTFLFVKAKEIHQLRRCHSPNLPRTKRAAQAWFHIAAPSPSRCARQAVLL